MPKTSDPRSIIVRLLSNIGSAREIQQYLKRFSQVESSRFAVIRLGDAILREDLDSLASSLAFLQSVGLTPIAVHGAGPSLDAALAQAGIDTALVSGRRVVSSAALAVQRRSVLSDSLTLVDALQAIGARATSIPAGVLEVDYLDRASRGFAGRVTRVHLEPLRSAVRAGTIPVVAALGETSGGQILDVDTDAAVSALVAAITPYKIIFLTRRGGLRDTEGTLISTINLATEYENLMRAPVPDDVATPSSGKRRVPALDEHTHDELQRIANLLESLPLSSSVSVTRPQELAKELFTHRGSGTMVRRGESIRRVSAWDALDTERLRELLESSFGRRLAPDYFARTPLHRAYLSEHYRTALLLTMEHGVPHLDKFAVADDAQGEGLGKAAWKVMRAETQSLFWRARPDNPANEFYVSESDGCIKGERWNVYWYGLDSFDDIRACVEHCRARPATLAAPGAEFAPAELVAPERAGEPQPAEASAAAADSDPSAAARCSAARIAGGGGGERARVGIIGARGHVGAELIALVAAHPHLELAFVSSRELDGMPVSAQVSAYSGPVRYRALDPAATAEQPVDALVLALPNGKAGAYVAALEAAGNGGVIVDVSADYRFDDGWFYGLPELYRGRYAGQRRISNPGCYATAMQLALAPLLDLVREPVPCFGVSGYSGAGTTPSDKNDPVKLRDNLMPYSLTGHLHEREVTRHLGHPVEFMPHVAPHFRGITMTVDVHLDLAPGEALTREQVMQRYRERYRDEPLVRVGDAAPWVSQVGGTHMVEIGGFAMGSEGRRVVVVSTLDNLLKGAASQALQNINLALGYPETLGIEHGG